VGFLVGFIGFFQVGF